MQYHILRTTKYYNYDRSPLDTCRFRECLDLNMCVCVCVYVCVFLSGGLVTSSCERHSEKWTQRAVKVKKLCAGPKTKNPSEINHNNYNKNLRNNTKNTTTTDKPKKYFCFGGRSEKATVIFGQCVELYSHNLTMGGGKDVSQIAPYMGTNQDDDDDKGSLWAWEFLFARCFFFLILCLVQYRSSLGSSVHIEVARGRSFGRSVRSACSFRRSFACC